MLLVSGCGGERAARACRASVAAPPAGSTVRYAALAGAYVVGNDIPSFGGKLRRGSLRALDLRGGRSLGRPAGAFWFLFPQAALDRAGRLHVVWGEPQGAPDAIEGRHFAVVRARTLWHAVYDGGWSVPERIHRAPAMLWNRDSAELRAGPDGVLRLVVPQGREVAELAFDGRHWTARAVPVRGAVYASVDADAGGRVTVAAIASWDRESNRVVVVQWTGRSWTAPKAMPGGGQAHGVAVRAGPGGMLHLLSRQNVSGGVLPEVIRHVGSSDRGATWSAPSDLDVPDGFQDLRSAVDDCGALQAVYRTVEQGRSELHQARWLGGWSEPRAPRLPAVSVDVGVAGGGGLLLYASAP